MRKLKTPWRDGTTHVVMSPLEAMLADEFDALCEPHPRLKKHQTTRTSMR